MRKQAAVAGGTTQHVLPPDELYLTPKELGDALNARATVTFTTQNAPEKAEGADRAGEAGAELRAGAGEPGHQPVRCGRASHARAAGRRQEGDRRGVEPGIGEPAGGHSRRSRHSEREVGWLVAGSRRRGRSRLRRSRSRRGFEDDDLVIISEQDMLGDKLARPRKRKSSAAVIAEAAALSAGDLIVHVEHGVGRYEGLKTVTVQRGAA